MKRLIVMVAAAVLALPACAQKEDWLPVTPAELQLKQVANDSGAPAIEVYYGNYIDDSVGYEFVYHRIKVLAESGKSYADVEIIGAVDADIANLKARTIHPDGSIVEFTGKPFNKTVFKGRGIKLNAKAFTLPDVTIGSIVEYKYKINYYSSDLWVLQHDLYTVREVFSFQPRQYGEMLLWTGRNLKDPLPNKKSGGFELEWKDVPAFQSEAQMPPEENYKPSVSFFYLSQSITKTDKYWEEVGKLLNDFYERYIGNRKEVREAALQAIGNEADPEKKLRLLYQRAQQIRNLSFERARTQEERKKEKLKDNSNLGDIVKRGYGDSEDVTAFFVGMARAAGFDAQMLLASSRRNSFFSPKLLSFRALTGPMALVKLNGNDVYLQPGVRFCPYGLMRWSNTSTEALRFDKKGGTFQTTPPLTHERSVTRRVAKMEVTEEGTLKGEITVEFQGQEALVRRLDARDDDDASKKKDLESELQGWLPGGATIQLTSVQGWEAPDQPLVATFNVTMPGFAFFVGKRLLLPSLLFQSHQRDAFKHSERKYPVYFPYPFTERDRVELKLPPGYALESVPPKQDVHIGYAQYQSVSVSDGKLLI